MSLKSWKVCVALRAGGIHRFPIQEAEELVRAGKGSFTPRHKWREQQKNKKNK